jgi:hypothetical protein
VDTCCVAVNLCGGGNNNNNNTGNNIQNTNISNSTIIVDVLQLWRRKKLGSVLVLSEKIF